MCISDSLTHPPREAVLTRVSNKPLVGKSLGGILVLILLDLLAPFNTVKSFFFLINLFLAVLGLLLLTGFL